MKLRKPLLLVCTILALVISSCDNQGPEPPPLRPIAPSPSPLTKINAVQVRLKKRFSTKQLHDLYRQIDALEGEAEEKADKKAPLSAPLPEGWSQDQRNVEMTRRVKAHNQMTEDYRARFAKRHHLSYEEMQEFTVIGYQANPGWYKH